MLKLLTDPLNWSDIPKRKDWHLAAAAFAIASVGIALRWWAFLVSLGQEGFWYDEAFTWIVSGRPLHSLIASTAGDVHPPLYYLLVHLWRPFPYELARLWSFAFSLAGLWLFWQLLKTFPALSIPARLAAIAVMALAPQQIHYANELRMYSLLQALFLAQLLTMRRRQYPLWALASVAACYTHNYGLIYTALTGLLALIGELRRPVLVPPPDSGWECSHAKSDQARTRPLMAWALAVAAAYIPWAAVLYKQIMFVESGRHWLQPITLSGALDALYAITIGVSLPAAWNVLIYAVSLGGLVIAVAIALRTRQYTLLVWALGAWLLATLASLITPIMLYRALLPTTGGVYILIAHAISQAKGRRGLIGAAIAAAILTVALTVYIGMVELGQSKLRTYDARTDLGPGLVVHLEDDSFVSYSAYPHPGTRHVLLTDCPDQIAALGPQVRAAMGLETASLRDIRPPYTLAVTFGAFANTCQENLFHQLTAGREPLQYVHGSYLITGVWEIEE